MTGPAAPRPLRKATMVSGAPFSTASPNSVAWVTPSSPRAWFSAGRSTPVKGCVWAAST
jgi:hypothetical protein